MLYESVNGGSGILRCLSYFISAAALHTWEVPLMLTGSNTFIAPPAERGALKAGDQHSSSSQL